MSKVILLNGQTAECEITGLHNAGKSGYIMRGGIQVPVEWFSSEGGNGIALMPFNYKNGMWYEQMIPQQEKKPDYGLGVSIGFLICAMVLLGFPKFTGMVGVAAWIFYGLGLVILLFGILGTCSQVVKK